MIPFILRLRVGWGYVSERLKERKTYYEAQSRGLFAQKDRETQLRDRLIEKEEVCLGERACRSRPRVCLTACLFVCEITFTKPFRFLFAIFCPSRVLLQHLIISG